MTVVLRPLVEFAASLRARRLRDRLHAQGDGVAQQAATLRALLAELEQTEWGRQHGLGPRMGYEAFRKAVPLRASADFRGAVERMAGGAAGVLWPGRCGQFVYTAGTVDGAPKMLPVTPAMSRHFRAALADAWLMLSARSGRAGIFLGRHAHVGASTALASAHGARAGYLEGILRASLSPWARNNLAAPSAAVSELPESPEKIAATVAELVRKDVRVVAGSPAGALALLQAARAAGAEWPRLECVIHSGAMLGILEKALREAAGPGVALQEIYAAAEGLFAAQDSDARNGLRLLTGAGIFFEFLPATELGSNLGALGERCLPLAEIRPGVDYALVVTNPAGLCRSVVGDTVRFVSTRPPRIVVTGRTQFLLNSASERVTELELSDALIDVCIRNHWEAVNFHVAPYFIRRVPRPSCCHEWWIELRPGTVRTPTGPLLAAELDAEVGQRNRDYAARRANGALEPPIVRLVMPGVFAQWSELYPTFGGAGKLARCRNDRLMADQLAGIARFHLGTEAPFPREP